MSLMSPSWQSGPLIGLLNENRMVLLWIPLEWDRISALKV